MGRVPILPNNRDHWTQKYKHPRYRMCWLPISDHHATINKHCNEYASVDYHGILVCVKHRDELVITGVYPFTDTPV